MVDVFHKPVLLQEACDLLDIEPGKLYIDATLGGAGHAQEIINRGGRVLGIDQDIQAISRAQAIANLVAVKANFLHLQQVVHDHNWTPVAGILFDLGLSSHHIDTPSRGFSFQSDGPLDMRMDVESGITAADLVNQWPVEQLTGLFADYGEVPAAATVARKIVTARPLRTTSQLAAVCGKWSRQVFQALRIAVNDELGALEQALPQALACLEQGGRLVVITFQSLEDRIVKNQFKLWSQQNQVEILTAKPITPKQEEISANSRSKSAKLRALVKK